MSYGVSHLQPTDEEDKLEYKDDGEKHLSCICVQLLTSNERETKVKVCCHIIHLFIHRRNLNVIVTHHPLHPLLKSH